MHDRIHCHAEILRNYLSEMQKSWHKTPLLAATIAIYANINHAGTVTQDDLKAPDKLNNKSASTSNGY